MLQKQLGQRELHFEHGKCDAEVPQCWVEFKSPSGTRTEPVARLMLLNLPELAAMLALMFRVVQELWAVCENFVISEKFSIFVT